MEEPAETVLVTGATGFLGIRLCERLSAQGYPVIALGRRSCPGPWREFREADLEKPLPEDCLAGVDTVFHLAGKAHALAESEGEESGYGSIIVEGTRRLLESAASAGVSRFIFVSSVKAMGEGNPPGQPLAPMDEGIPPEPVSPYGRTKAEAEKLVFGSGLPHTVVLRPVMVYGPGEKGNLPRMVNAVRQGRFPPLPDTGNHRSMVHVDDVIGAMLLASRTPQAAGRAYIITGKDAPSTRQLYDAIRTSLGMPAVDWSVPLWMLRAAAFFGSLIGGLLDRRMPLDCSTLEKLTGSAWYSSERAASEIGYRPSHGVIDWLLGKG